MKLTKQMFGLILTVLFLFSCSSEKKSDMLDEVITGDNLISITEKLKTDKDVTSEELELYSNGLARSGISVDSIIGKKVGDIIEKQRNFKKEYILDMLSTQTSNLQIHMNLGFKYIGVQKADNDTLLSNILHFEMKNKSNSTIKKVEGELEFYDLNNQIVKRFPIRVNYNIEKGKDLKFTDSYQHVPSNPRDTIIRSKFVRLQALWKPTLLEFADGKKLVVKYKE
ncbi:MAG: hypothetical protein A2X61_13495 [Ignavibacteria bacterium GWB2_35_12]|nr:MAG: hypothetical protein A2X63_02940 [Ignavibacteria bacterium GWA2_35_8]OGU39872.1 MAG: hypothetical protein A2X61_13495 [Ignavibacteria bacterium GWB2_35_12]OGU86654.1 MAG: hypothetical protein A2220_13970 [Ignavibacteria bacterium RIFOXYA2_FULL_35_10]OGV21617.1 MAG: hypothetical protein A2475_13900 [Ignavibacteria bacterium RIFOXYC2_FULL_35_21]